MSNTCEYDRCPSFMDMMNVHHLWISIIYENLKFKILTKPSFRISTKIQLHNLYKTSAVKYWPNSCSDLCSIKILFFLILKKVDFALQVWKETMFFLCQYIGTHILSPLLSIWDIELRMWPCQKLSSLRQVILINRIVLSSKIIDELQESSWKGNCF